jgi:hypothetical protein
MGYGGRHFLTLKTFHLKWGAKKKKVFHMSQLQQMWINVKTDCKLLKATNTSNLLYKYIVRASSAMLSM